MTPRWYQEQATDAAWRFLCSRPGSPVIILPTGAGKSLVLAMLAQRAIEAAGRVVMLAHRKELLQQNADKLRALLPGTDIGIYSAGLKSRDTEHDILVAGIQSIYSRAGEIGARHLVLIDEVHLVPDDGDGMYRSFLADLQQINPRCRMVGLTATPFRTGTGKLCRPDAMFQEICYSVPVKQLIDEGFLCGLKSTVAESTVDTSGLHIRGGEFIQNEMAAAFGDSAKVDAACREIVAKTRDRNTTLIFCSGVQHAKRVACRIENLTGEPCGLVTGETSPIERAATLAAFRNGTLRKLANVDVLTTGFDAPNIDAISVLRATASPGLFAQICGRGFRIAPGKDDCLILDFGENIRRHGPIDAEDYGQRKKHEGGGAGDAPEKTCPNCEESCPLSATECECGYLFPEREPREAKHGTNASNLDILQQPAKKTEWIVEGVSFARHRKRGATPDTPDTLRVDYVCTPADGSLEIVCGKCGRDEDHKVIPMAAGHAHHAMLRCGECNEFIKWLPKSGNLSEKTISEWVCLEHDGYALDKALKWWRERSIAAVGGIDEAIDLFERGAVAAPTRITTKPEGQYTRIVAYELDAKPETWREPEEAEHYDAFAEELPF